jgi:hypothetical protein
MHARGWIALFRRQACLAAPLGVALVVFALSEHAADWSDPVLLLALLVISALSLLSQVSYDSGGRHGTRFDASYGIVLVALVYGGPLPAFLIWALPEIGVRPFLKGVRLFSIGLVSTIGSFALATLAASFLLAALSPAVPLALAASLCGLVLWLVNFALAGPLYSLGIEGLSRAKRLVAEETPVMLPAVAGTVLTGVVVLELLPLLGTWALAPLAIAVVLPQLAFERVLGAGTVRGLTELDAARLYAEAIADVVGMTKRDRRVAGNAAALEHSRFKAGSHGIGEEIAAWIEAMGDGNSRENPEQREALLISLRASDRHDGLDWPHGLSLLEQAPLASRIVACARAWAELTTGDKERLRHRDALLCLRDRAGTELDPQVVSAAARVIDREALFLGEGDLRPRLHTLPLPRSLRTGSGAVVSQARRLAQGT